MALRTTAHSGSLPTGGGAFAADLQGMDSAVQQMQQFGDVATGRVNKLFADLESELHAGTWQGEAARAFAVAKEEWGRLNRQHMVRHQRNTSTLHGNRVGYNQAESDNLETIQKAAQGLT